MKSTLNTLFPLRTGLGAVLVAAAAIVSGCFDDRSSSVDSSSDSDSTPSTAFEDQFRAALDRLRSETSAETGEIEPGAVDRESQALEDFWGGFQPITGATVITSPGIYRLVDDFKISSGDAIVVQSDHVWLDLHAHTVGGPGNKEGHGVLVDDSNYVFVGKGKFSTFGAAVALMQSDHCLVTGNQVQGGDEPADPPMVPAQVGFLLVNSSFNMIVGNRAELVNLGIFVRGGESHQNWIARNQVVGGENGLLGVCYNPVEGQGTAAPHHDLVRNNFLSRFDTGIQTKEGAANNRFVRNVIEYFVQPWEDLNGSNQFIDNQTTQL